MVTISAKKIIALDSLNGLKPVACIIVNSLSFLSLLVTIVAAAKAASGAIIGIIGGIVKIENSKNTRKKLRGGAKKVDIITNETQISNLDPNTIIKDIDVGDITNPLGESVDELSESDEMYPPDPDKQIKEDMMLSLIHI